MEFHWSFGGEQCFGSLVRLFGYLIMLDKEIMGMSRLDRARMLVRIFEPNMFSHYYNDKINGEVYKVHFVEEIMSSVAPMYVLVMEK